MAKITTPKTHVQRLYLRENNMNITYEGSCHCQKVQYSITMEMPIKKVISCNCSICSKKGTLLAFIPKANFTLLSGENVLTDYQFNQKIIHHYFCSCCGVTSFGVGKMPDGSEIRAINVRCLKEINIDELEVKKFNGKEM